MAMYAKHLKKWFWERLSSKFQIINSFIHIAGFYDICQSHDIDGENIKIQSSYNSNSHQSKVAVAWRCYLGYPQGGAVASRQLIEVNA